MRNGNYLDSAIQQPRVLIDRAFRGDFSFPLLEGWEEAHYKNAGKHLFNRALETIERQAQKTGESNVCFYLFFLGFMGAIVTGLLGLTWFSWLRAVAGTFALIGIAGIVAMVFIHREMKAELRYGLLSEHEFIPLHDRLVKFFKLYEREDLADLAFSEIKALVELELVKLAELIRELEIKNEGIPIEHWQASKKALTTSFEEGFYLAAQFNMVDREAGYGPFYAEAQERINKKAAREQAAS